MSLDEGYLLCVFGDDDTCYDMAKRMIENIHKYDTSRKICILSESNEKSKNILQNTKDLIYKEINHSYHEHEKIHYSDNYYRKYFIPKVFQSYYTPFKLTLYFDLDLVFHKDFTFLWFLQFKNKYPIQLGGKSDEKNCADSSWHMNEIDHIIKISNMNIPEVNTSILMYNTEFFGIASFHLLLYLDNLDPWKVKKINNHFQDDIIYAILCGKCQTRPDKYILEWILDPENCEKKAL